MDNPPPKRFLLHSRQEAFFLSVFGLPFFWLTPPVVKRHHRWPPFLASLLLHGAVTAVLFWLDSAFPYTPTRKPQYQVVMLPKPDPENKRVLWYDFRRNLPEVAPAEPFGPTKTPQGEQLSTQTIVAQSTNAQSDRQLIYQPNLPKLLPADIPAPNLVALPQAAPPAPPEPAPQVPKPQPKRFVPPPEQPRPDPTSTTMEAPSVDPTATPDLTKDPLGTKLLADRPALRKPPARRFVPTPGTLASTASGSGPALLDAPQSGGPQGTGSVKDLQAAIIGLNPTDKLVGPPPEGSRGGQFSRAPIQGPPSSGTANQPGAPKVPGLMARGTPGAEASASPSPANSAIVPERRLLKEVTFPTLNRTMSVPLRPAARVIPASVESIFANRSVYTILIPAPNLPDYSNGDWVLWFAGKQPTEAAGRILAPVPARKFSWSGGGPPPPESALSGTVQLAAVIDRQGRLASPRIVRGLVAEAFRHRVLEEFKTWEFQPATRNGEPMEVDVVLEIAFQFRPAP